MIQRIKLEKFTAFEKLEIPFSEGINVFIGESGTGKTHILKMVYSACDIAKSQKSLAEKINRVFLPSGEHIGRLVKRTRGSTSGFFEVSRQVRDTNKDLSIRLSLTNHTKEPANATVSIWTEFSETKPHSGR